VAPYKFLLDNKVYASIKHNVEKSALKVRRISPNWLINWSINMRITIVALGTRGDVQPMIALGKGLAAAGHQIRMIAGRNFADWVRSHGLDFVGSVDMEAVMSSEKGIAWAERSDNPRKQLQYMRELLHDYGDEMIQPIIDISGDADLLVSGFVSNPFVQAISEKYGIQQISALLQPYPPTSSGAASLTPIIKRGNSILNLCMGYLSERLLWTIHADTTNHMRRMLGLPPHTAASSTRALRSVPTIFGFSRYVIPPASDWGKHRHITGYWFLDEAWQPPDGLVRFLEDGPSPVYIGFGSMSARHPQQTLELVFRALEHSGQRGVLARGWSRAESVNPPENIYVLDKAPHSCLFPRMAGIVHHGGAGTTAAGLRAGVPSFIIPHMADQPYWGRRVYELGIGVKPVPRHKLTVDTLADGIRQLVDDRQMREAAASLGEKIRSENGVENAVQVIEHLTHKTKVSSP
jgi:UDP:flavonoid glycosyltransferase YjiC (YdhE family)